MIQVLDRETINQIAAGEVIERPMAVVKELVENSIDAGATAVTVEIKEGGISFVRVTDNGSGIRKEEIPTAFLRHATSKIRTMEDLLTVHSLGFRGEALSSIAAVAQVELITREADEITGCRYEIQGGQEKKSEEVGCPQGTTFIVRNLFYNTPARRKFLKTKTTEGNYVQDLMLHYSLAHPEIRFHFICDGRNKLQTSGDGQVKTNIYYNYGPDVTKCLIPLEGQRDGMTLCGFIGKPELSRGNRGFMNYFVNGRYIKSPVITGAIEQGYKEYLMNHRYPFTVLSLTIDSRFIDVNVHPSKMEVRFTNQEDVYQLFYESIKTCLGNITLIPEVKLDSGRGKAKSPSTSPAAPAAADAKSSPVSVPRSPEPFEQSRQEREAKSEQERNPEQKRRLVREEISWGKPDDPAAGQPVDFRQTNLFKEERNQSERPSFRIIGQVFETYWLIEYQSELLIIDQHAAHEKVLYEKLMARIRGKKGLTQNLAAPIVVTLSGREMEILQDNREVFEQIGFSLEPFGDKEYLLNGVPADFLDLASKELFLEILDSLMEGRREPEMVLDHVATMACKAAVKGNNTLSMAEAGKLIEEMLSASEPYHCPHGRPTTIAMSKQEFEKKFKRII